MCQQSSPHLPPASLPSWSAAARIVPVRWRFQLGREAVGQCGWQGRGVGEGAAALLPITSFQKCGGCMQTALPGGLSQCGCSVCAGRGGGKQEEVRQCANPPCDWLPNCPPAKLIMLLLYTMTL